jgi:hypothetical protein
MAAVVTVSMSVWAQPASARVSSPRPEAKLLRTGTITTEEGEESYIKVRARDVDGIITEIQVLWGDDSATFAHSYPCLIPPTPEPGDPHKFLISHKYENPGRYQVKYVVYSTSDCSGSGAEQHSRVYKRRLAAP